MAKLWFALGLALVVAALTLIIGLLQDARIATVIYRMLVSFVVFGAIGYFLALAGGKFWADAVTDVKSKGKKVDIINEEEPVGDGEREPDKQFVPLAPDNLERLSRSEN